MNTNYAKKLPKEWRVITNIFAALGEPTRQKIIMLFEPGEELAIKDIAAQFKLGRTTVVHHLTVLEANGILTVRRRGRETLYSVVYDAVLEAIQKMQLFMEGNIWAEVGAKARNASALTDGLEFNALDDGLGYDLDFSEETPLLFINENDGADKKPKS